VNECAESGTCQHTCVDKKVGYACECFPGFKTSPINSQMCVDIDECQERACSQICRNSIGAYKCECAKEYILKDDEHTCKANSSKSRSMLLDWCRILVIIEPTFSFLVLLTQCLM